MAYSKTVWNNNTPPDISAENLNKMEQGIADAQFPDGGSTGQILSKTNDGTEWVDAPNSAEWGNITGQLSEQTDLVSQLDTKITMPSGGTTGQVLTKTATGEAWEDVDGLPAGGTTGQVLTKNSSTSGDASWQDVDGLPSGGTAGQVLTKNSSTDGDASWQTSPSGGGGTWGYISGTLTDQTDLVAALDAKANTSNLATIESSTTASQEYSTGDHLVLNGQLYEVIADIDSGETLTVGTNISATTVGDELTSLNNGLTTKSGTVTLKVSGRNNLIVRQYGHVVSIWGFIDSLSLPANTETQVAQISGVSLPVDNVRLRGTVGNAAYAVGSDAYIVITTAGIIAVNPSVSGSTVYFNATYIR